MAEQRRSSEWDQTASQMTLTANAWSTETKFELSDFHPFIEKVQRRTGMTMSEYLDATEILDKQRKAK